MKRLFHRSALFELLARAFRRAPEGETLLAEEVEPTWRECARSLSGDRPGLPYSQVLGGTGSCADGEVSHRPAMPSGMILADLAGFYQAFGFFELARAGEKPDHISVELEFVAFLFAKEAHALASGEVEAAAVVREAREGFFRHHLAVWVASFAAAVESRDPHGFFAGGARAAVRAVGEETTVESPGHIAVSPDTPVECGGCPAVQEEER